MIAAANAALFAKFSELAKALSVMNRCYVARQPLSCLV